MYKLTQQTQNIRLTPKEAEKFLALNNFPGQRELRPLKVRHYADMILRGEFRPANISIATAPNGQRFMMNGQHVCNACLVAGKEILVNVDYFRCESESDLWHLYASFDVHATRTQVDIFKGARGQLSDVRLREIPLKHLSTCGTSLLISSYPNLRFDAGSPSKTIKVELVDKNADFVMWSNRFHQSQYMATVGVTVAMIMTWRSNKDAAEKFWQVIHDGIGFTGKTDPRYLLRERLVRGCDRNMRARNRFQTEYVICVSFWNDWRSGITSRKSVKIGAMKSLPEVAK